MEETVAEYNAFLQKESPVTVASVLPHEDVTWLASAHTELANAVGGVSRLHSIGRFLQTKLKDPNFQKTALNIFGAVLGTAVPQASPFIPLIKNFLGQINPDATGSGTNQPAVGGSASGNTITIPVDSTGALRVILTDERGGKTTTPAKESVTAPPPMPNEPGGAAAKPTAAPKSLEQLIEFFGGTVRTDANGNTVVKRADGTEKTFNKEGIPVP
jgi:hypothetical protein